MSTRCGKIYQVTDVDIKLNSGGYKNNFDIRLALAKSFVCQSNHLCKALKRNYLKIVKVHHLLNFEKVKDSILVQPDMILKEYQKFIKSKKSC